MKRFMPARESFRLARQTGDLSEDSDESDRDIGDLQGRVRDGGTSSGAVIQDDGVICLKKKKFRESKKNEI